MEAAVKCIFFFFFSTRWFDLRRQKRLMNDYEAEAQREKQFFFVCFFFDRMNSDGAVPAQSPRRKRGLVPVQF